MKLHSITLQTTEAELDKIDLDGTFNVTVLDQLYQMEVEDTYQHNEDEVRVTLMPARK